MESQRSVMTVYCYNGDEAFLRQDAVKQLKNTLVDSASLSWRYQCLKRPSINTLVEALGTVSFNLGGAPVLEIQDFDPLESAVTDIASQNELTTLQELLTALINESPETTTKHVVFHQAKLDRKVKFAKWLLAQSGVQEYTFKKLNFWEAEKAVETLVTIARQRQITLEPNAAQRLVEQYGVALQPLVNEVEKLAIYANGRAITAADVATLSNHHENTFDMLSQWIHGQNRGAVYTILEEVLLTQHPVQLFGVTQSYLDQIFKLRYFRQLGWTEAMIADHLKKHPFKVKKDLESFQSVSFHRLTHLKKQTLSLEWQAKTGQLNDRLALEVLMGQ